MDTALVLGLLVWMILPLLLAVLWIKERKKHKQALGYVSELETRIMGLEEKYEPAIKLEKEVKDLEKAISEKEKEVLSIEEKIVSTRASYSEKKNLLNKLTQKVAIFDEKISFGRR